MSRRRLTRRQFVVATAAGSAALITAPYVRSAHAAGKLSVGFWDHWVPGANKTSTDLVNEWAEKEKVEVAIDYITSNGRKNEITIAAEAMAQRKVIEEAQDQMLSWLRYVPSSLKRYEYLPYIAASIDAAGLEQLQSSSEALDISEDKSLRLTLAEPILATSQDGPFTLYNEAPCKVEMQVELPRDLVKNKDVAGVEALLRPVVERHASEDQARASRAWNKRQREAYPADYDETLARHSVWKAEQTNAAVQAGIDRLIDETSRIPDRISDDPDYMAGFVKGVEAGRAPHPVACPDLMTIASASPTVYPIAAPPTAATAAYRKVGTATPTNTEQEARRQRGYQDGLRLTVALDAVRRMPGCIVQVPEAKGPTHH